MCPYLRTPAEGVHSAGNTGSFARAVNARDSNKVLTHNTEHTMRKNAGQSSMPLKKQWERLREITPYSLHTEKWFTLETNKHLETFFPTPQLFKGLLIGFSLSIYC